MHIYIFLYFSRWTLYLKVSGHVLMCFEVNLWMRANFGTRVCAWYKTDEDDRCDCISAWVCVCVGGTGYSCAFDRKTSNRHGSAVTALWVSSISPSLPSFLLPSSSPKGTNSATCHLGVLQARWSTPLLGRRMSAQARGSFDKQSIYWYMIKYARNHPTAEGYYSFNIIIWINKHSVEK